MKFVSVLCAALTTLVSPAIAAPKCDDQRAIWATEADGVRRIVYGSDGVQSTDTRIFFEEWRNGRLAWRVEAEGTCSNGASICSAMVRNNEAKDGTSEPGMTDAIIEVIDHDGDEVADYVIFAGLGQSLYYSGGAKASWFNGFAPAEGDMVLLPNIYKFLGCRKKAEIELTVTPTR
ncbi:hypothetical protein [Pseudorhizobium flavum]|uniref:hypothetical protein n=1 Tax=Pseudorhizobium flavum TaxID=1335061 RepID=UPI00376FB91D